MVELRVGGLSDLAHAAFPEQGRDVVVAEAGAGAQGHALLSLLTRASLRAGGQRVQRPAQKCPEKAHKRGLRGSAAGSGAWGKAALMRGARGLCGVLCQVSGSTPKFSTTKATDSTPRRTQDPPGALPQR